MADINQIIQTIAKATDYQKNKRILREKIQTDLHFTYNGGLFKSSPELIVFAGTMNENELYLEDTYQNPIHIADPLEFSKLAKEHYHQVMNRWHQQHEELKKIRKI